MDAPKLMFSCILALQFVSNAASYPNSQPSSIPLSVLSKAMLGVDPVLSNPLSQSDKGLRKTIFLPLSSNKNCNGINQINNFIGKAVEDVRCNRVSSSSMRTASNFNSYRKLRNESVSFKTGGGLSAQYMGFGGGVHVGYGSGSDTSDEKHREFFQKTEGEIVLGGTECQTHVVSVKLNAKPVFTENFVTGLRKLNLAAQDPSSQISIQTFHDFVDSFGTHFQDTTTLGSKVVIEKLFAKKAANTAERTERELCVSSSFTQSFQANVPFVQAETNFSRDADRCSGSEGATSVFYSLGLYSERVITVGAPPYSDPEKWAENAMKTPVPIYYKLEKISRIFTQDWFDDYVADGKFNGTAMRDFFENLSEDYCNIMLGRPCAATCGNKKMCRPEAKCVPDSTAADGFTCKRGCGITSDCPSNQICVNDNSVKGFRCVDLCSSSHLACSPGESCHAEPHSARGFICVPTKPGRAVVAGGGWNTKLSEVESLNYKAFPDLPRAVSVPAMAKADDHLYVCGGRRKDSDGEFTTDDCYRINVHTSGNEWQKSQSLPIKLFGSAVSLGDTLIWFFGGSTLVKFDSEKNDFNTTTLPFDSMPKHCSVSNEAHAYVIGAGNGKNEIWTNKNPMDETEWELAGYLMRSRESHACLWYGSNIMITGGYGYRSDVELFNTETREVWAGKEMLTGLQGHKMMLHNGTLTVVGGHSGVYTYTSRITSFSTTENKWIELSMKLKNPKAWFALVEV